jgi:hypothetical protein
MYFYNHKTNRNEQTELLEVHFNVSLRFRNDGYIYIITNNIPIVKGCG